MANWNKENFNIAIPQSIARLDFNQHREQHIKNYTAIENVLGKEVLEAENKFKFLNLNDTPDSYLGQGGKFLRVNSSETGLEFAKAVGGVSIIRECIHVPGWGFTNFATISDRGNALIPTGQLFFVPLIIPSQYKTSTIFFINPISQTTTIRVGLYSSIQESYQGDTRLNLAFQPYQKLFESVDIPLGIAEMKYIDAELDLGAGIYFIAYAVSGETEILGMRAGAIGTHMGIDFIPGNVLMIVTEWAIDFPDYTMPFPAEVDRAELYEEIAEETTFFPLFLLY